MLCPKLQQHCTVSCKRHVTVNSKCVSSLTGTRRATPSSNTALSCSPCLSESINKPWEQGAQNRHLMAFVSVVICSCFGQVLPQPSVKCRSCFHCACQRGIVHKNRTCYLNYGTPERCPPLNVIALSDK